MIEFLSSWAQGIIVAVIIATLIEMILPNSSSKKYVKVVIGSMNPKAGCAGSDP